MAVAVARAKGLLKGWRAPQHRDGLALVVSSGMSSAVGLLYWVLAAQIFPADVVGVNAVMVSSLMLVGGVAHLNMSHALLRFVPVAGIAAPGSWCAATSWRSRCPASQAPVSGSVRSGGHRS